MSETIEYGLWEGDLTIAKNNKVGPYFAYRLLDGKEWQPVHPADVFTKAGVISKETFYEMLPKGVELPKLEP